MICKFRVSHLILKRNHNKLHNLTSVSLTISIHVELRVKDRWLLIWNKQLNKSYKLEYFIRSQGALCQRSLQIWTVQTKRYTFKWWYVSDPICSASSNLLAPIGRIIISYIYNDVNKSTQKKQKKIVILKYLSTDNTTPKSEKKLTLKLTRAYLNGQTIPSTLASTYNSESRNRQGQGVSSRKVSNMFVQWNLWFTSSQKQ